MSSMSSASVPEYVVGSYRRVAAVFTELAPTI
jgi:hypothetical protein